MSEVPELQTTGANPCEGGNLKVAAFNYSSKRKAKLILVPDVNLSIEPLYGEGVLTPDGVEVNAVGIPSFFLLHQVDSPVSPSVAEPDCAVEAALMSQLWVLLVSGESSTCKQVTPLSEKKSMSLHVYGAHGFGRAPAKGIGSADIVILCQLGLAAYSGFLPQSKDFGQIQHIQQTRDPSAHCCHSVGGLLMTNQYETHRSTGVRAAGGSRRLHLSHEVFSKAK
ncbi:unnamed protein product [Pleuronectes platessa]|uniref:Uncharacterized protein n=1 Tax=Pleuronectes platessa TaxID=8262 RepID=A0A9N7ZC58_PLEPL|nr:unnamed protein product [Pleuronectes platessa]